MSICRLHLAREEKGCLVMETSLLRGLDGYLTGVNVDTAVVLVGRDRRRAGEKRGNGAGKGSPRDVIGCRFPEKDGGNAPPPPHPGVPVCVVKPG